MSDSQANFFVRTRGKVSGPYSVEALQQMVRRGSLSRVHEVSADRTSWAQASEYEELFPAAPTRSHAKGQAGAVEAIEVAPEIGFSPAAAATPMEIDRFYYSQNGAAVGPVPLSVLKILTENGTLLAHDMVWREHADSAVAARQVPALAALFSIGRSSPWSGAAPTPSLNPQQGRAYRAALQRAASASMGGGIIGGGLLLMCLLLPWFATSAGLAWWWDLYRIRGTGVWAAACTYLILCGVALCIIGPTTRGVARGICYVSLAGFAVLFVSVAAMRENYSADGPLGLLIPLALASIVGVCSAREALPQLGSARVLLGVFSGIVTLGIITGGIQLAANEVSLSGAPGEVVAGFVTLIIGALAALAGAITGFVGLKPYFSPGLNLATRILALAGIALPIIGVFLVFVAVMHPFYGLIDEATLGVEFRFQVAQAFFRFIVIWCALLMVVGVGLCELLVAAHGRSNAHGA